MVKFKSKTKDCQLKVRAKLSFDENVSMSELDVFSRKMLRGFLKPVQLKTRVIEYTGPVGISLYDRLKRPITKYDFFFIMEQIVNTAQILQQNNFPLNNVVWNLRYVYINEATKGLQLIYLPSSSLAINSNILSFIEMINYSVKPSIETDMNYVSRFAYFLQNIRSFNAIKIENYIIREESSIVRTIKKQFSSGSGFMTDKQMHYIEHYENDDEKTGLIGEEEDEATGILDEDDNYEATKLLFDEDEATGLLEEDDATRLLVEEDEDATSLLEEENIIVYPTLFRMKTEEKIEINKPVFRIGKERSFVDFFVSDNSAVSRSHADIITRGKHYYVIDLNSKNRTFINSEPIAVQCETEIFNGDQLRLANEEFIFYT